MKDRDISVYRSLPRKRNSEPEPNLIAGAGPKYTAVARSLVCHEIEWSKVIISPSSLLTSVGSSEYSPSIDCRNTCDEISSQAAPREVLQCNLWSRPRPPSQPAASPPLWGSPASRTTPAGPGCPREHQGEQRLGLGLLLRNIKLDLLSLC